MSLATQIRSAALVGGIVAILLGSTALSQAPAVATGDARTVTEPSFPATCQMLQASFHDAGEDVPASVEATSTELDQGRLQAALNACANSGQAVELSMDVSGNNAFLTGPISIPSGVTLLVDPGVTLYFSRNAQDYDTTPGVHTCGTVDSASNTGSCRNLITMNGVSNAGIMGYGKLNGRGGEVVLNSFATPGYEASTTGKSWWDLAADAGSVGGSQQNPRGIQITNATNITLYKITFKNSPNFHIAINTVNGFTAWGIHIVTPYSARNTDGIDPGNATDVTITQSWISDGDDNVALGANASATMNVSVINNRFFAGHGESIGSLTNHGVSNALFDNNTMYGDADVDGGNSTAIRIKTGDDRGGVVQNIQYSNSCFANHGTQIQFNPLYDTTAGTLTPDFKNILLQNLRFSNQGPVATGSFQFQGVSNNGTINPLVVTLDNLTVDTVSSSNLTPPLYAHITLGPGQVSSNLVSLLTPYNGVNGNIITDNRTASSLNPPVCSFTFLAPSLTGPAGVNQTVVNGQFPTAVVILQPAFASISYPYPTGTVTVIDESSRSFTATLSGTGDTTFVPITNAPTGVHTYTASYSGDSVYPAISSFGNYTVTVTGGSLPGSSLALTGVPGSSVYGSPFTATALLSGNAPTGSVSFLVNGAVFATVPVNSGTASYTFNLGTGTYSLSAIYSGDTAYGGSTAAPASVSVTAAPSSTDLRSTSSTGVVGTPVGLTATVTSAAGTPAGTVTFSYTTATNKTPTIIGTGTLTNGVASYAASLPQGTDNVLATYNGSVNFSGSVSSPALPITLSAAPPVPASTAPIALPYTMSTLVGGGTSNSTCTGHTDSFGDGCQGNAVVFASGTDLRSVAADPFGNVYFTDATAAMVRKVSPSGIVTDFAGYISGSACVATATAGCTPTLVKFSGKPRGIFADAFGNLFIAGYGDNKVQYVSAADGKDYLIAGTGSAPTNATDSAGDGGPATSALLKGPRAVATDNVGNVYIADSGDNRIREVLAPVSGFPGVGTIQTVAGTGVASSTGDGGLATAATVNNPQGVAVDPSGNIYIAEGSRVRAVCVDCTPGMGLYALLNKLGVSSPVNGDIYTVAGTSSSSNSTLAPGLATTVNMSPQKISLDPDGNIYIADSGNKVIWFEDGRTGYTRVIAGGGTTTSCPGSPIGDGCPATQATIGSNGGNGMGVALDTQGNMYIADSTNLRIREVSTDLRFPATAVGTAVPQTLDFHSQPGDTFTATAVSSPDFTVTPDACTTLPDTTRDCTYTATFKPVVAGLRDAALTVDTANANDGTFTLGGLGMGAGATLDPATQILFGKNVSPSAIVVDPAGNVLVADSISRSVLRFAQGATGVGGGSAAVSTTLGSFMNPISVAADALGNVYVGDGDTGLISKIGPNGTTTALAETFTTPKGLATDSLDNLYVLDSTTRTVTEIAANGVATRLIGSGFTEPTSLAVDASGDIYVGDSGAIYRYDAQTLARSTVSTVSASPAALALDAAGNLFIADNSTGVLLAIPASANSASFTLASGVPGATLALDGAGNVYTNAAGGEVAELLRTQGLATYSGTGTSPSTVHLLSTANLAASLTLNDPDTTNFGLSVNSSTDCVTSSGSITLIPGGACTLTSSFTPTAANNYTNIVNFTGNAANTSLATPPALQLTQVGDNAPAAPVGMPQLISTSAIAAVTGGYRVTLTVQNTGDGSAGNVTLTNLSLGSAAGTPLPVSLGTLAVGASTSATVTIAASAGPSGAAVVEKFAGTYTGGTFGGSVRTRLP